jgi:hypothetical protein
VRADDDLAEPMLRAARGEVVLLAPEHADLARARAPQETDGGGSPVAAAVALGPNRLTAKVDAPAPGWLVVLDPWFPGWTATVDGAPSPLARANFAFLAVPVAAGRHEVVLAYRAGRVAQGALLAGATAALLAGTLAWRRRASRALG